VVMIRVGSVESTHVALGPETGVATEDGDPVVIDDPEGSVRDDTRGTQYGVLELPRMVMIRLMCW
jgi:hypothetical protein